MALSRLTDSAYADILKILQEGKMQNTLSEASVLWKYAQKLISRGWEGKQINRPLRTSYGPAAVGNIQYNDAFKSKSDASFTLQSVHPKYVTAH